MNFADISWVLISTALVFLMTPAVGLFYGGMVRRKNILSTLTMCFATIGLVSLQWVIYGYSLVFGKDTNGVIGGLNYFLLHNVGLKPNAELAATIPHMLFMAFQMMFAVITPALIVGTFVERIKFSSYVIFTLLWSTLVYDVIAHWVWGPGGWLRNIGALDFAGGTVVHITAGISALSLSLVIRKRIGFGEVTMEPNSIPMTVIGSAMLWFGWFGFNGGSSLAANEIGVNAFVTTNVAAAAAAAVWMLISWIYRRPSAIGIATGAVVGLVAITPAAGYVSVSSSIIIGAIASVISFYCIRFREKLKLDESLDVWACHGMGGTWGAIATGIFASKAINPLGADGLLYGGSKLFVAQIISVLISWIYSFVITFIIAKLINKTIGLSVSKQEEMVGLDISQHGEEAYGGI